VRVVRSPSGAIPSDGPQDVNDCCHRLFADRNALLNQRAAGPGIP
jgi:hypothetical protein